jgi:hypothetical protein
VRDLVETYQVNKLPTCHDQVFPFSLRLQHTRVERSISWHFNRHFLGGREAADVALNFNG